MFGLSQLAIWDGGSGSAQPTTPLFIFAGESNSGGYAVNADLSAGELAARPSVRILNNTSLVFQNLDIGTNNIIDHAALDSTTHGLEGGLANLVEGGRISASTVYLLKTGQGGDKIATWALGHPSNYWAKFLTRWAAVQSQATLLGITFTPYVFYSQGINDAIGYSVYGVGSGPIAGSPPTDTEVWKTDTVAHLAKIRALIGANTRIVMTKFNAPLDPRPTYNTKMDEIAAADPLTIALDTTGVLTRDGNHWSAVGFKMIAERFIDQYVGDVAAGTQLATPAIIPHGGEFSGSQSVSMTGPAGAAIRYTEDGIDPRSDATLYTAPFSISTGRTIKALAVQLNRKNSAVDTAVSTRPQPITWSTTDATASSFFLTDDNLTISSVAGAGWRSCRATVGQSAGKLYWELKAKTGGGSGNVMVGFGNAGATVPATYGGNAQYGMASVSNQLYGNGFTKLTNAYVTGTQTINTVWQLAIDFTAGNVWVGVNNTWLQSGDPAAGTNPAASFTPATVGELFPLFSGFSAGVGEWTMQALSTDRTYSPPSGFSSWLNVAPSPAPSAGVMTYTGYAPAVTTAVPTNQIEWGSGNSIEWGSGNAITWGL